MKTYKHTQIGYWIVAIFGFIIISISISMVFYEFKWGGVITLLIFVISLSLLSTLTVTIEVDFLKIQLGPIKVIQKRINLKEIEMYKIIDIPWYYRWILGIRLISNGWWYNISGSRKAIEIQMIAGKRYQISTNDWKKLEQAIGQAIEQKRNY
jgi:hypothetical protein